jgi:hypothetical protein
MKHLKTTVLAAVAATALMAFVAPASATTLTSPAGTTYTGALRLESEGPFTLHGTGTFTCGRSSMEGKVESHGSSVTTVSKLSQTIWNECSHAFSVLKTGSLEIHTDTANADGNGTLTWNGAELTITWNTVFGNVHCTYTLGSVNLGTIAGSKSTGSTATASGGATKMTVHGGLFCQSKETGIKNEWTSPSYRFTTPDYLDVD